MCVNGSNCDFGSLQFQIWDHNKEKDITLFSVIPISISNFADILNAAISPLSTIYIFQLLSI